jgi:hypothetical protein
MVEMGSTDLTLAQDLAVVHNVLADCGLHRRGRPARSRRERAHRLITGGPQAGRLGHELDLRVQIVRYAVAVGRADGVQVARHLVWINGCRVSRVPAGALADENTGETAAPGGVRLAGLTTGRARQEGD